MQRRGVRVLTMVACAMPVLLLGGVGVQAAVARPPMSPPRTVAAATHPCSSASVTRGASAALGLRTGNATRPVWSARLPVWASQAGMIYSVAGDCVVAVSATTGKQRWSSPHFGDTPVMGMLARPSLVLVALGAHRGHAPAAVFATTVRLVALDPATGALRWSRSIADDGQGVPAIVTGGVSLVTQASGTVVGIDARTGSRMWRDPRPRGCPSSNGGMDPVAVPLNGVSLPVVLYQCGNRQRLIRLDPATGTLRWGRQLTARMAVINYQALGAVASGVIGLLASSEGSPIAPVLPGPAFAPASYGGGSLVAVSARTGKPLWQRNKVASAASIVGENRKLCAASGYALACFGAWSGSKAWIWRPPVVPTEGGWATFERTVVVTGGRVYTVYPTKAASSIPPSSTTYRSAPGTFRLDVLDLATGRTVDFAALPAYYGGPNGVVVSADDPPSVPAVAGGNAFVCPQTDETDVIEAIGLVGSSRR